MSKAELAINSKEGKPLLQINKDGETKVISIIENNKKKNNDDDEILENLIDDIVYDIVTKNAIGNSMRQRNKDMEVLKRTLLKKKDSIKSDPRLNDLLKKSKESYQNKKNKEIKIDDGEILPIPNVFTRECGYIGAPSGSGKSTYVRNYAKQYNKLFPKNKVFLFSKVKNDESLNGIKNLVKIKLDDDLIDDPIEVEELANSLVIFDDIDTLRDKEVKKSLKELQDDLLETGRHDNVHVLVTTHQLSNYRETKTVLNEAHFITVFPSSGSSHQIRYVLKNYVGLDNKDINKISKLNSRWVTVYKHHPQVIAYENGCYLVNQN